MVKDLGERSMLTSERNSHDLVKCADRGYVCSQGHICKGSLSLCRWRKTALLAAALLSVTVSWLPSVAGDVASVQQPLVVKETTCHVAYAHASSSVLSADNHVPDSGKRDEEPKKINVLVKKEKNQCPREGMFSVSFAKVRGRDEG